MGLHHASDSAIERSRQFGRKSSQHLFDIGILFLCQVVLHGGNPVGVSTGQAVWAVQQQTTLSRKHPGQLGNGHDSRPHLAGMLVVSGLALLNSQTTWKSGWQMQHVGDTKYMDGLQPERTAFLSFRTQIPAVLCAD